MHLFHIILAVIGGIFVILLAVAYIDHRLHPDGYETTPDKIRTQLQDIIDGRNPYAFDDFTSVGPLKDPRFEAIRRCCPQLPEEFPAKSKGELFSSDGVEAIRAYIKELSDGKA